MTTVIRELKADDKDEFCRFLGENFYGHEPLLQTPGDHQRSPDTPEKREARLAIIQQGLSLAAVDHNDGDRIVGVAYAEILLPGDLEESWMKVAEKKPTAFIQHVHYFITGVEKRSQLFEHYKVKKALYLNNLTVDSSVRCQGLGRRLVTALMDMGRSKGFPLLATCCTSLYSTRVMLSLGMSYVHSENYVDYKDEDGNMVIRPPAPHTAVNVMAIKFPLL
ncbi:uncharacterized protein LOC117781557 [Drosophila innubila]|uniref:uncharacterized protein LOC117781557 n=1 Tax=Drosophila innubila TaxID=198719 RepID=UPI00148CAFAD|nr:uncharacterized protein LOC117781557 [Drosophila innubila]